MTEIYTIGHSNRSIEEFIDLLKYFKIDVVVDVRRFPSSRKFPWFNKEFLREELEKHGIKYFHLGELGGYRREKYVNYAETREFEEAVRKLLTLISPYRRAAIMCSESKWWKCHRRFIAGKIVELGHQVTHILSKNRVQKHLPKQ